MTNKKTGAPLGSQNAKKEKPFNDSFPASRNFKKQKARAVKICKKRKIKLSAWVREAVNEKIKRDS